ncbi:MAG TPA: hypothetical protein VJN67_13380 [Stellaceae bacterium]|nr:hypothetical protein [Stellaceae bacterium]
MMEPERVSQLDAKLRRAELHVHFGCGAVNDDRFLNVDARAFPHVDLVTASPMMPDLPPGRAASLYACHAFEHIPHPQQIPVLRRWHELLCVGGRVMLSVPDFEKILRMYEASGRRVLMIQGYLMGAQDYPENFHCGIFTHRYLSAILDLSGFVEIAEWHPRDELDWPRDLSWDDNLSLNLCARKR